MSTRRGAELEAGYLLHRRAYGDTSALLEALVRDHGRVGLVARGIRGRRARLAGVLQPFQPLALSWSARGELGTLTGAEASGRAHPLTGTRLASGFYANELLLRVLPREDPHPELFDAYAALLQGLAGDAPEAGVLRRFEYELLAGLGYALVLEHDVAGRAVEPDTWYRCDPEAPPSPLGGEAAGAVPGAALLALAAGVPDPRQERRVRDLLRRALRPHIGERPLRSREIYRRFAGRGASPDRSAVDDDDSH